MGKGSGRRPAHISEAELNSNWERTFPKRRRMKIYHFHSSKHEAIHADLEEQAILELKSRHPFDFEDFTLEDVQDVPEPPTPEPTPEPTAADEDARSYRDE